MNIAVLGLFNSGSTVIAGILHRLGVNMGPPFHNNFYESRMLKDQLENWWSEPKITENVTREYRIVRFREWLNYQLKVRNPNIGIKHPLLCLSGSELQEAWGYETRFIWAFRPIEDSIDRLVKRKWYLKTESIILQKKLWVPLTDFFNRTEHLLIDCNNMRNNARMEIQRIIGYLSLVPSEKQINDAIDYVVPPNRKKWKI